MLGDLAVSLRLNPLYLMLPATVPVIIIYVMIITIINTYDNDDQYVMIIDHHQKGDLLLRLYASRKLPSKCHCLQGLG